MGEKTVDKILHDHNRDGVDPRGFLKFVAWAGNGALRLMQGGVVKSFSVSRIGDRSKSPNDRSRSAAQDSHLIIRNAGAAARPEIIL
jgi:hypothetical protein